MENIDWMNVTVGGLAIAIFIGGLLMMFTGIWTAKDK
jgi:succinate-acetate transporter protein